MIVASGCIRQCNKNASVLYENHFLFKSAFNYMFIYAESLMGEWLL